ncbi:wall-associated receptor kinase-like 1 [Andrographis paniculata]|uniref:wall-associated receptor kinase-like 1 n=1 Tax=Andrographis paniculata TaxID=175694 RepID=UPI0021E7AD04|nr:wall-associated receptor kinase-like 1 [Andrographis paniculata]
MEMKLPFIHVAIYFLCLSPAMVAQSISLSKHGCPEKCGDVTIPYPFGIGSKCSANSSFTIICNNSTNPPKPILSSIDNLEVLEIFLKGTIVVNQRVSPLNCSSDDSTQQTLPISLSGSPFYISSRYNSFVNLGCKNSVWLLSNSTPVLAGCTAFCRRNLTDAACNGVGCCRITIPERLQELQFAYKSTQPSNGSFCGYAFPVAKKWLQIDFNNHTNDLSNPFDKDFGFAPIVLEWEAYNSDTLSTGSYCRDIQDRSLLLLCMSPGIGYKNSIINKLCSNYSRYSSSFSSFFDDDVDEYTYESTSGYCDCYDGYEGNPYLPQGCIDNCPNCYNNNDNHSPGKLRNRIKIAFIVIGSVFGGLILLCGLWRSGKFVTEAIKAVRRYMFYKRNGGLLLEQHLASTENGLEKTKLFTSKELQKATDHYNKNRILGRGGQGTVYKGMLTDGKIVAVKKSKKVDEGDLEVFINEVVIVSQINHRNVVRLLGCCLETEVPLLVYEFIPNGTLFSHIHEPSDDLPLTWEMRMRIASEVAGALAYLHSASSAPIYHRDIKSTNILLDEKYRAKVSDFGASRSVSIDQTHITTRILGTFGYLDPEYFQSSQFTEKSDVYSFGVVVVELLTGEKAVTSVRAESGKSLATHFLHTMEENKLFDILDSRVLTEGNVEDIAAIAELARKCLHLNGKKRPTMKEVAADLDGIRRGFNDDMVSMQHFEHDSKVNHSVEVSDESSDFSSFVYASTDVDSITDYTQQVKSRVPDEP